MFHPDWVQGVEIVRGCRGVNLVGCDLVEVSPPYDTTGVYSLHFKCSFCLWFQLNSAFIAVLFSTGNTALTGANLLFEMLCVLPNVKYY